VWPIWCFTHCSSWWRGDVNFTVNYNEVKPLVRAELWACGMCGILHKQCHISYLWYVNHLTKFQNMFFPYFFFFMFCFFYFFSQPKKYAIATSEFTGSMVMFFFIKKLCTQSGHMFFNISYVLKNISYQKTQVLIYYIRQ
jgi:hypothetical protein